MAPDGGWSRAPLDTAAQYAAFRLALLPECAPTCPCGAPGKRPWDPGAGWHMASWQERGAPTADELGAWLGVPGAQHLNIGCRCGPGCLGADSLIGADGPRGVADLGMYLGLAPGALEAELAQFRKSGIFALRLGSAAYMTQGGGIRVLWRVPAGATLHTVGRDKGHDGLRLAWTGGQVVLPRSAGPEGQYRWLPRHSPWQVGFQAAPGSVVAAMGRGARAAASPSVARQAGTTAPPVPVYPPATGDLGPDRDGRMVPADRLPYALDLLRDGLPKGQRSEAVRRLELALLRAGWTDTQIVGALAAQAWVQPMRPRLVEWLCADVARALAWLAQEAGAAPDRSGGVRIHPTVAAWLREQGMASAAAPGSEPVAAAPAPDDDAGTRRDPSGGLRCVFGSPHRRGGCRPDRRRAVGRR